MQLRFLWLKGFLCAALRIRVLFEGTIDYLPVLRKCVASRNSGQVEELMS